MTPYDKQHAGLFTDEHQIAGRVEHRALQVREERPAQSDIRVPKRQAAFFQCFPKKMKVGPIKSDVVDSLKDRGRKKAHEQREGAADGRE